MTVIERCAWRDLAIHVAAPGGASLRLKRECAHNTESAFVTYGIAERFARRLGLRNESLDDLTASFDLFVTHDVMVCVAGIGRVLKPGGAHVFTVPLLAGRSVARYR